MKCSTCRLSVARLALLLLLPASCAAQPGLALGDDDPNAGTDKRSAQDARRARRMTPIVKVFQEASPAVVNISTTSIVTVHKTFGFGGLFDDIFDFPRSRRPRRYKAHSVGSGFLIHGDGYIVTNAHVVDRVSECMITLADGTELAGEEVALDRRADLAVLKVEADRPLPYLKPGRSDDLMPGETVIAIGNPFGFKHTVTTGIISALNRELRFSPQVVYSGLIQTDAPINPGNSGGPLFNVLGELIGITSAIRGDAENIGFAIPIDRLHDLLPEMLDVGRLRRVRFGVHFTGDAAAAKAGGVRVKRVDPGTPAAEAGVRAGDTVTAINGKATPTFMEAFSALEKVPVGRTVSLDLRQDGGKDRKVRLALEEIPRPDVSKLAWTRFGIRLRELGPSDLKRLGLRRPRGLMVTGVGRRSQATREGVSEGDLVTMFGGWPVTSFDTLGHLLNQVDPGDLIPFKILRIGGGNWLSKEFALRAE